LSISWCFILLFLHIFEFLSRLDVWKVKEWKLISDGLGYSGGSKGKH
jgi:hypothetical protein